MSFYLEQIRQRIPQVLSQIDREPFSLTYGCGDRVYWCWKFTDFPGARFQEYIYTLAWLYSNHTFDNEWRGNNQLLRMIEAGFDYWASIQYDNGGFDEAYPFENSLAATAFTTFYLTEAWELVRNDISEPATNRFLSTLKKAGTWLSKNDELHGILSNHLAAAAAACYNAGSILNDAVISKRCDHFLDRIYAHQSEEGWYEEYGGADAGYQTHGSFYLARIWQKSASEQLLGSLKKANHFLSYFIHPDGSLGGEYCSRDTMFYYPAAFEMLYAESAEGAAIADHQYTMIGEQRTVGLEMMDAYNLFPVLNNYIFAYNERLERGDNGSKAAALPYEGVVDNYFESAGIYVRSNEKYYSIVGVSKGGVVRIWNKVTKKLAFQSAGYVIKDGKNYLSSQSFGASTTTRVDDSISISAGFVKVNRKVFNPWLFGAFRIFMLTIGRFSSVAYRMKRMLVKALVNKENTNYKFKLEREVRYNLDSITINDKLTPEGIKAQHLDKFSTIHMGSSRYVHLAEEIRRGSTPAYEGFDYKPGETINNVKIEF
ncbi:MAG: hypothetical protein IH946_12060 [Bacteroidetes bacterium]|nr:hypothetical protein [Bacteroidota bacterium]